MELDSNPSTMDEFLILLLVAACALLVIVAPVLAIVALVKAQGLERRLRRLEATREGATSASRPAPPAVQRPRVEPVRPPAAVAPPPTPPAESKPTPSAPSPAPARRPDRVLTPPTLEAPARSQPPETVSWEKRLGVVGAAVVGGLLLALAGILLFQHALREGWVTPQARLVTGSFVGLGCLGLAELFRKRDFRFAPAATAGAGLVVLYATSWAASRLYGFVPIGVGLGGMALVTAAGVGLALRFDSLLVAVLGLAGGFATPLLLSTGTEEPLGLFGYLLLLDLGLVAAGRRRGWRSLGTLGVIGTYVVLFVWWSASGGAEHGLTLFAALTAVGGLFAIAGAGRDEGASLAGGAASLLLPFAFALQFAAQADLGERLWPLAIFTGLLVAGAALLDRLRGVPLLPFAATCGTLGVFGAWMLQGGERPGLAWDYAGSCAGMVALLVAIRSFLGERAGPGAWRPDALMLGAVGFVVLAFPAAILSHEGAPWPLLFSVLAPVAALHVATSTGRNRVAAACRLLGPVSIAAAAFGYAHAGGAETREAVWVLLLAGALLLLGLALWTKTEDEEDEAATRWAWRAAALLAVLLLPTVESVLRTRDLQQAAWLAPGILAAWNGALLFAASFALRVSDRSRASALRWSGGFATALVALSVARWVDHDVVVVGAALTGLGLALLARALPHPGLEGTSGAASILSALLLGGWAFAGLVGEAHFPAGTPLASWTSYACAVPTLCVAATLALLRSEEPGSLRTAWAHARVLLLALLAFLWLNLEVLQAFETDEWITFDLGHEPARDFSLSIAWTLFASSLLVAGLARRVPGLRQISLGFLLLTLGKVFLHDLGLVQGLWRVGSLAGLAVSLLLVSLAYQRWVFPRAKEGLPEPAPDDSPSAGFGDGLE